VDECEPLIAGTPYSGAGASAMAPMSGLAPDAKLAVTDLGAGAAPSLQIPQSMVAYYTPAWSAGLSTRPLLSLTRTVSVTRTTQGSHKTCSRQAKGWTSVCPWWSVGARVHSDSWGEGTSAYTEAARQVDEAVGGASGGSAVAAAPALSGLVPVFAAGNTGAEAGVGAVTVMVGRSGLAAFARHVIQRFAYTSFPSQMASCDVAISICQSLSDGAVYRQVRAVSGRQHVVGHCGGHGHWAAGYCVRA
jgi:hypothetical protein